MPPFPTLQESFRLERLSPPAPGSRVVIDTDTDNEIDDQFALVHALLSPSLNIEAVYAAPFVNARAETPGAGMERSYAEILNVYAHLGLESLPPVFRGSRQFLTSYDRAERSDAAEHLVETAFAADEPLYVLAIGAITNVANALLLEPKLTEHIVVVWLGGNAHGWPYAQEFNLQGDLLASALAFSCGVPLVQLPCQGVVANLHTTVPEMAHYVRGRGAIGNYLYKLFDRTRQRPLRLVEGALGHCCGRLCAQPGVVRDGFAGESCRESGQVQRPHHLEFRRAATPAALRLQPAPRPYSARLLREVGGARGGAQC